MGRGWGGGGGLRTVVWLPPPPVQLPEVATVLHDEGLLATQEVGQL